MAFIGNQPKWNTGTYRPASTRPANPTEGMTYYDDGSGSFAQGLYQYDGTNWTLLGSDSGGLDVFYTETFESDVTASFETGNNATALAGGTIDGTLALDTTTPISGLSSLIYTQDASSLNDYFASPVITLDRKQSEGGQLCTFKFRLRSTHDQGDLRLFFANGATDAILETYDNLDVAQTDNKQFAVTLFIPDGTPSLKYGFQVLVSNNGATLTIDDVEFTQNNIFRDIGNVTDMEPVTVTGSWTTNTTYQAFRRQVGDRYEYDVKVLVSGAPNATPLNITLPSDSTIDVNKIAGGISTNNTPLLGGVCHIIDSSAVGYHGVVTIENANTIRPRFTDDSASFPNGIAYGSISNTAPITFASGDFVQFNFSIPVVGLDASSDGIISSLETRPTVSYEKGAAQAVPNATDTVILYDLLVKDVFGDYNTATGEYTVAVPGNYLVNASVRLTGGSYGLGAVGRININVNGSLIRRTQDEQVVAHSRALNMNVSTDLVGLNRGDVITISTFHEGGGSVLVNNTNSLSFLDITKVDKSAIGAFPMASAQGAGLINYYNETTLDLTGSGNFTGGTLKIIRVGNQVTINNISTLTFSSSSSPTSSSGFIPVWARPAINQSNLSSYGATIITQSFVASSGTLAGAIRNYSGTATSVTVLDVFNISYNV